MPLTFTTLDRAPAFYAWREQLHADPTVVTPAEQGCILSRLRATVTYRRWHVQYKGVNGTDKETIRAFELSVGVGADAFYYTNPYDSATYLVRLAGPMSFVPEQADSSLWQIDFDIYGAQTSATSGIVEYYSQLSVLVPQQGAGVDFSGRPVFSCPNVGRIQSVGLLFNGAPVGIDDTNTAVVTIKDGGGNTIATKTYNTATQPPTDAYDSLDAALNEAFGAGAVWTMDLTQGATANMAELYVVTTFYVEA